MDIEAANSPEKILNLSLSSYRPKPSFPANWVWAWTRGGQVRPASGSSTECMSLPNHASV